MITPLRAKFDVDYLTRDNKQKKEEQTHQERDVAKKLRAYRMQHLVLETGQAYEEEIDHPKGTVLIYEYKEKVILGQVLNITV